MNFGVSGIPQRVESTGPRRDESGGRQDDQDDERDDKGDDDECAKERLELLARDELSYRLDKGHELEQTKDACG